MHRRSFTKHDRSSMEEFTVLLYDKTATPKTVDELKLVLFTKKGRQMLGFLLREVTENKSGQSFKVDFTGAVLLH